MRKRLFENLICLTGDFVASIESRSIPARVSLFLCSSLLQQIDQICSKMKIAQAIIA